MLGHFRLASIPRGHMPDSEVRPSRPRAPLVPRVSARWIDMGPGHAAMVLPSAPSPVLSTAQPSTFPSPGAGAGAKVGDRAKGRVLVSEVCLCTPK